MRVQTIITPSISALRPSDTVEHALGLLMEYSIRHLPVVDEDERLVGVVSEDQLMEAASSEDRIERFIRPSPVSVHVDEHLFDAARIMVKHGLTTLPVTRGEGQYEGLIKRYDIFDRFAQMLATQRRGAILALEVDPRDYALAKLIHAIEQNDAKVRAVASEPVDEDSDTIRVTLKLNVTDTSRIRHVLEHHGYRIVASFGEEDEEILERAEEFMRFLEV